MTTGTITGGLEEMEYRTYESQFGGERSVSIPAQFRFTEVPSQNTRRLHVELYRRGYADLDTDPARRHRESDGDHVHYDGEICSREHYLRMKVLVFRGGVVRLYPHDGWEVTAKELGDIIEATEMGFGAPLEHNPIKREGGSE